MFTAYKIGITVGLTNQVSGILGLISRDFMAADAKARALKGTLNEIKLIGTMGLVAGGLGYAGLRVVGALIKPANEYAHQLNIMNMAGMKHAEIMESVAAAWKNTGTVITTTATENLRSLLDLRNILSDVNKDTKDSPISMDMALKQLPLITRVQAVMASSKEGAVNSNSKDFAFSMAKALDIVGAATSPEKFEAQANMMAKVITATQGRVTPGMFQSVFQYARQGKFDLSDEFKYEFLPTLMLEASQGSGGGGGGSRGVGPAIAAMYRFTNQGYINKKSLPELQALGLVDGNSALRTTSTGTTVGAMKAHELAAQNPYRWVNEVLVPAIKGKYGPNLTEEEVRFHINQITRGNQLAAAYMVEFATKQSNFMRDQKIIRGAMGPDQAYMAAMRADPQFAQQALHAQWENFKTAFGITVVPFVVRGLMAVTTQLNSMARFFQQHPRIAEGLAMSFTGLSGALAFSGVVWTVTAAVKALSAAMTLWGAIPWFARLVGGGAAAAEGAAVGAPVAAAAGGAGLATAPITLGVGALGLAGGLMAYNNYTARVGEVGNERAEREMALGPDASLPGETPKWFRDLPWWPSRERYNSTFGKDGGLEQGGKMDELIKALGSVRVEMDGNTVGRLVMGRAALDYNTPPRAPNRFDLYQGVAQP